MGIKLLPQAFKRGLPTSIMFASQNIYLGLNGERKAPQNIMYTYCSKTKKLSKKVYENKKAFPKNFNQFSRMVVIALNVKRTSAFSTHKKLNHWTS